MTIAPSPRHVPRLSPSQPLRGTDQTVGEFWAWAFSDLVDNATRGVLAEFIVGSALGALDAPRRLWDAVDLRYRAHGIEVKSGCAVQAWPQRRPTPISFSIRPAVPWAADTNEYGTEAVRSAAVYVFAIALIEEPDAQALLDTSAWEFHVVGVDALNELGSRRQLSRAAVRQLCDAVGYSELRIAVDNVLDRAGNSR